MTPRDEIERCARALVDNRGATYSINTDPPMEFVMIPMAHFDALRSALSRPAPATEAKCPSAGASEGEGVDAMRYECAEIARRGAVAAYEQMANGSTDAANPSHTHAEAMEAVGNALSECESQIRALRPTPPHAEVEAKRREFYEAMLSAAPTLLRGNAPYGWDNDTVVDRAKYAHDALLAAERAERGGKGE